MRQVKFCRGFNECDVVKGDSTLIEEGVVDSSGIRGCRVSSFAVIFLCIWLLVCYFGLYLLF